ncbi:MAG: hypothetical protein HZB51_19165 [Chloroflexi bacterium]|nr:hypothetical protein [Chloroflexota bacterium]
MRVTNLRWLVLLSAVVAAVSGCSGNTSLTPAPATRSATQTPWLIYVPVTVTPEPVTITPLPTAGLVVEVKTPTRTATRPAVVRTATRPAPTVAPVAAAPTATPAPACSLGSVAKLIFPNDGALRHTKLSGFSPDTFDFQWTPFQAGETDATVGYRIELQSKLGSKVINGDIVDVQHNWFINNGQHYIYDQRRVQNLVSPAGDIYSVTWTVTVIKVTGGFDNTVGKSSGTVTRCGPATGPFTISLQVCGDSGC